jgi:hypothetical protein
VVERIQNEDESLKSIKVKYGEEEQEVEMDASELDRMQDKFDVKVRILTKSGKKISINGFAYIYDNLTKSLISLFDSMGLKMSKFKLFHGKEILGKDETIENIQSSEIGLNFFACESLGKPSKWRRFEDKYGDNTWSNAGRSHDRLTFIPTKDILFAGFSVWAAKDEPKFFLKYKIVLDGKTVIDKQNPIE